MCGTVRVKNQHSELFKRKINDCMMSYRQAYEWAISKFRDDHENIRKQYLAH